MTTKPGDIAPEDKAKIDRVLEDALQDAFDRIDNIRRGRYTDDAIAKHLDRGWALADMYTDWVEQGEE